MAQGSSAQRHRVDGYASKAQKCIDDVAARPGVKTLVMVHRHNGYKLLLRLAAARFGNGKVRGFPPAKSRAEREDPTMSQLLGAPHDEGAAKGSCKCALCTFNRQSSAVEMIVADAMECGEGVSFLGVRRLLLLDVPVAAVEFMQRIGRAVRFMGHAMLPAAQRRVEVLVYQA